MLEAAITLPMPRNVHSGFIPNREGCWTPDLASRFIAHINHFPRWIRKVFVGPRCQLIFVAIL